ncbi:MAG: HAMP domain-containing histidine kinase, partial [Leptospira sp.]|nr:HAMP domain-containing histidine kinase [Leptospira sp.]
TLISIEKEKLDLLDLTIKQNHKIHQFSQIVSHNIRNHSANISILLELLEEDKNEIDFKKHMSYLVQSSHRLSETTELLNKILNQDIHTFSNIEPIPIKRKIEEILDNINPGLLEIENHISIEIPEELLINGINKYIENILHHLLTNSIRYRSPNRSLKIQISHQIETDYSIINISDNGIGIDLEKNQNKIFQMYRVFNNQPDAKGLGLFISKAQMELMGGKIEVRSKVDHGTVFSLYFKN